MESNNQENSSEVITHKDTFKTVKDFILYVENNLDNNTFNIEDQFYWVDPCEYPSRTRKYAITFYKMLKHISNEYILNKRISFFSACASFEPMYHGMFIGNLNEDFIQIILKQRTWYIIEGYRDIKPFNPEALRKFSNRSKLIDFLNGFELTLYKQNLEKDLIAYFEERDNLLKIYATKGAEILNRYIEESNNPSGIDIIKEYAANREEYNKKEKDIMIIN